MTTDRVIVRTEAGVGHITETEVYEYSERVLNKLIQNDIKYLDNIHEGYYISYKGDDYDSMKDIELEEDEEITAIDIITDTLYSFYYEVHDIIRSV